QHIAWGESNAIAFAKSVIGARTNRYADLMDIWAAIVGKVPEFCLHLTKNRRARILIRITGVSETWLQKRAAYPLLGYIFGEMAGDRVAAIDGIPAVSLDCLKSFSAAASCSGAVGLFHVIGVTPEALSQEMCFKNTAPEEIHEITPLQIMETLEKLSSNSGKSPDLIAAGCPHYSYPEFDYLAKRLNSRRIHDSMVFWVFTSRSVYNWIRDSGLLTDLKKSGVTVFTDGCPLQYPKSEWHFSAAMSDSAKYASYCFSQTGLDVTLGSIEDCVETAVHGKLCRSLFT
ncbi:MAG: aconitase X, partial [Deltaproteobacteria bacterium]|nr:aconitase X [Deltaproteobacteria bacterium]